MRSLRVAASLLAALTLAACAGTPDKNRSEQEQIVNSIMGGGGRLQGTQLRCPAHMMRYCSGPGSALDCSCVSNDSLRRAIGRNY
jgi:hypothetical protein